MALTFKPSVGQILVCNYGQYCAQIHPDGHLPPEMVKNRLVVVLNAKHPGGCVVVPLSTTYNEKETDRGYHVEMVEDDLPHIFKFPKAKRWAKANMIETVSKERLDRAQTANGNKFVYLDPKVVEQIQRAVIKVISANSLLTEAPAVPTVPEALAAAVPNDPDGATQEAQSS